MKPQTILRLFPLVATLALVSCKRESKPATQEVAPAAPIASQPVDTNAIRILDDRGSQNSLLKETSMDVVVGNDAAGSTFHGELRASGQRRYTPSGNGPSFEVKSDDDGFKLRSPTKLLWKVKYKDDKIKISDNEENLRPIELKVKKDRIEVSDQGLVLGEVRFNSGASQANIMNTSNYQVGSVGTRRLSSAFGLLLAARIPAPERAILELEIFANGR
jgi:hypothetical protein